MKKGISLLLSLVLMLAMCMGAQAQMQAGTFSATAPGRNGDVTVEVVVSENAIESVSVTAHQETAGIADTAIESIPEKIVSGQTLAVDVVSGSTLTSEAILAAAEAALTQAGADIEALKTPVAQEPVAALEDMDTQVLVVGSGLAGLAAAVSAREAGAEVIVVEKLSATGGTSKLSGGGIAAPGSHLQKEAGIEDSPMAYVNQWMHYQSLTDRPDNGSPNRERAIFLAERGAELIEWLEAHGYEFGAPTSFGLIEGVDRFHYPSNLPTGQTGKMTELAEEAGATILLDTRAVELLMDGETVVGAKMEKDGQTFSIRADAVILATGGYSYNEELIARLTPENLNTIHVASPGSTGDGLLMAEAVGAALYENQWLMGMSYAVSTDPTCTLNQLGGPWSVNMMVDCTGERFMNEFAHPNAYTNMVMRAAGPYYSIYDSADEAKAAILAENEGSEYLVKGETLEELAANAGFDTEVFVGWVQDWNNGIKSGSDAFGAKVDYMSPLSVGPFYAVKMTPQNMDSMGGIVTDLQAQVLRADGSAIDGLYAAGAISNGELYDTAYMSGSAVLNCYVMGRIAGENAAARAK